MIYDLRNELERGQFLLRAYRLNEKADSVVDLVEKRPRTLSQNNYMHLAISYFALQIGETEEYCKRRYFKQMCNTDIFLREKEDKVTHETTKYLRSIKELNKEECSLAIDRFLKWASETAGIYIPEADQHHLVQEMKVKVEQNRRYL